MEARRAETKLTFVIEVLVWGSVHDSPTARQRGAQNYLTPL
jgi:hypothetical protein